MVIMVNVDDSLYPYGTLAIFARPPDAKGKNLGDTAING